jgi:hypothetical protein
LTLSSAELQTVRVLPIQNLAARNEGPVLHSTLSRRLTALLLCLSFLLTPKPAKADIISSGQVAAIGVGIAAIGAAIGVGIYFLVRKPPSITGCAASGSEGLSLRNEDDANTYTLIGDTASIKPGERVRVSGKKKKDPSGQHSFLVEKVSRNYGACQVAAAKP